MPLFKKVASKAFGKSGVKSFWKKWRQKKLF
jgi:hypothetical protein